MLITNAQIVEWDDAEPFSPRRKRVAFEAELHGDDVLREVLMLLDAVSYDASVCIERRGRALSLAHRLRRGGTRIVSESAISLLTLRSASDPAGYVRHAIKEAAYGGAREIANQLLAEIPPELGLPRPPLPPRPFEHLGSDAHGSFVVEHDVHVDAHLAKVCAPAGGAPEGDDARKPVGVWLSDGLVAVGAAVAVGGAEHGESIAADDDEGNGAEITGLDGPPPSDTWMMDGSEHRRGRECCGSFSEVCDDCGGVVHFQPVYGGIYRRCEKCGATP